MAAAEVYIGRANTCFMNMKKTTLFLMIAGLVGLTPLQAKPARVATDVQVYLNHTNISGSQRFSELPPVAGEDYFKKYKREALTSLSQWSDNTRWLVYNIPICVNGTMRTRSSKSESESKPATVIPELTVTVTMLYSRRAKESSDKKSSSKKSPDYYVINKKITYVDIPLERDKTKRDKNGNEYGYAEMSVGVFVPQTVVTIMGGDNDPTKVLKGSDLKIEGFAINAEYKGNRISGSEPTIVGEKFTKTKPAYSYLTSTATSKLDAEHWASPSELKKYGVQDGVRLFCISETPYAPFYGTMYPATKPLYGEPTGDTEKKDENPAGLPDPGDADALVPPSRRSSSSGAGTDTTTLPLN